MKQKFINLEFILAGLIVLLFVGGFFFVVYEPGMAPSVALPEAGNQKPPVTSPSTLALATDRPMAISTNETFKSADPEKILSKKSESSADPVSPEADFGVEGAVFALESGLPLAACQVTFDGQSQVTDQAGEFHLWLTGMVGRLSFACAGFMTGKAELPWRVPELRSGRCEP